MNTVPTLYYTDRAVVFTTYEHPLDPYLSEQIDERFKETGADALILGQGPMLSLGFIDPRDFSVLCPNNSSFAVSHDSFKEIGGPDLSLGSACTADYLQRMKAAHKEISLALDIIMPSLEKRPLDVSDLWIDGLLLDAKHGDRAVKKGVSRKLVNAFAHYDASIGHYSRKNLLKRMPSAVGKYLKYWFYRKTENKEPINFFELSTLRGEYKLELSRPDHYPLVSIVVRTCGRPGSLRSTLNSLRYQAYKNFEVVVIEDGEPVSKEIAEKEYKDLNVSYYSTGKNIGRSAAANLGFRKANGDWINMLDDDDYLYPEHLRAGLCAAEATGSDMVFLKSVALDQKTISAEPYEYEIKGKHFMNFPRIDPFTMCASCKTPNNGVLFRRELLSECGYMNETLGANEDWELWLRFMSRARYTTVDYATCAFVNPADEAEKTRRDEAYKPWRGMQFNDISIRFNTKTVDLIRYYLGLAEDFDALDQSGELAKNLQDVRDYYFMYTDEQLEAEYEKLTAALEDPETKEYTAKQFNLWYCAVCYHLMKMSESNRTEEIRRMREREYRNYPTKKIRFAAFWPDFDKGNNIFMDKLKERYRVVDSDTPDYLFCSMFGSGFYEYLRYECPRIFFSGENYSPDFNLVDYAMSYDYMEYPDRYLRVPEYYTNAHKLMHRISERPTYEEALEIVKNKEEFCNFIYGDSKCCEEREGLYYALNKRKHVCSAGRWLNNMENGFVAEMLSTKEELQRRCRFTISVESYPIPGFTTEKITDAFLAYSIPIYYGDPIISEVFNEKAFIDARKFSSTDDLVDEVLRLDSSPEEMARMISEPVFKDPDYLKKIDKAFEQFLYRIVDQAPGEALRRPCNGQPEVHQNNILMLQKQLSEAERKR